MSHGYDEGRSADANQALALYEIAEALRELLYGIKYSRRDGLSLAEAVEVSGAKLAEAIALAGGAIAEAAE